MKECCDMTEMRESNSEDVSNKTLNEDRVVFAIYECLNCDHRDRVWLAQKDYSEVRVCPKCKGDYVDLAVILKYRKTNPKRRAGNLTIDIDCSKVLKGLKAVTREAKKATAALKEFEEQQAKLSNGSELEDKIPNLEGRGTVTVKRPC